jgi:ubiquinone/menaquinone biosynthesis C-methylase UbiE
MVVLDLGCGMGYFSLDMAKMVGPEGRVVCVDLQRRMIQGLVRRASKAGVLDRIDHRVCDKDGLGLEDLGEGIDFALAFAIVHEVPDAEGFFRQVHGALRPGGTCLLAEPQGHVSEAQLEEQMGAAKRAGLEVVGRPVVRRSRAALLKR